MLYCTTGDGTDFSERSRIYLGDNLHICAILPNLVGLFTVPTPGEQVLARLQLSGHLDLVHDVGGNHGCIRAARTGRIPQPAFNVGSTPPPCRPQPAHSRRWLIKLNVTRRAAAGQSIPTASSDAILCPPPRLVDSWMSRCWHQRRVVTAPGTIPRAGRPAKVSTGVLAGRYWHSGPLAAWWGGALCDSHSFDRQPGLTRLDLQPL